MALVIGLTLTATVAALAAQAAAESRALLFEAEVTRIERELSTSVNGRITEFQSGVNFVKSTHPGPIQEYEDFFSRELPFLLATDPGAMVFEVVDEADLDRLVARELTQDPEFDIVEFPGTDDQRWILTRATRNISILGFDLRGLDVSFMRDDLLFIDDELFNADYSLQIIDSTNLIGRFNVTDENFDEKSGLLIATIGGPDQDYQGFLVRFETVPRLFDMDDLTSRLQDLNLVIHLLDPDEKLLWAGEDDGVRPSQRSLATRRPLPSDAAVELEYEVWADPDFGPATGLLDQTTIWLIGTIVILAAMGGLAWRDRQRRRVMAAEFELEHAKTLAMTDGLTGLLNRQGFIDGVRAKASASGHSESATLFFIDLDGFKAVNDTLGHDVGDEVLRSVAERLRLIFRDDDLIGRLGGDEFVVYTEWAEQEIRVDEVASRVAAALAAIREGVTGSIGVANRPVGFYLDVKDLLRQADQAMYDAKRTGGNRYEQAPLSID